MLVKKIQRRALVLVVSVRGSCSSELEHKKRARVPRRLSATKPLGLFQQPASEIVEQFRNVFENRLIEGGYDGKRAMAS
jgi:hypothetical protein